MSAYQRFIESSARKQNTTNQNSTSTNTHSSLSSSSTSRRKEELKSKTSSSMASAGIKTAPTNLFTTKVSMNVSSTPIDKQQYKQLVEANHRAIRLQREQEESSASSPLHHHHQQQQCARINSSCLPFPPRVESATQIKLHYNQHMLNPRFNGLYPSPQQQQQQQLNISQDSHQLHCHCQQQQQQQQQYQHRSPTPIDSFFKTDDPVLLQWLQAMRFETELECLTSLQTRSLATDEYSAGALSIRNSQVAIQDMRLQSDFTLDYIDSLINLLPLQFNTIAKFTIVFSELWNNLVQQTAPQSLSTDNQTTTTTTTTTLAPNRQQNINNNNNQQITIINCTPRKSQTAVRQMRPKDMLANQLRNVCIDMANQLYSYQDNEDSCVTINNEDLEASLRKLKELYGKYIEISMRFECANIVRGLDYDFSQSSLNRLSSSSSLHPTRPFESCSSQLPLKWSLIALWQLTKEDTCLCRLLTEKWQTVDSSSELNQAPKTINSKNTNGVKSGISRVAKRLDYSTKYDSSSSEIENAQPKQQSKQQQQQVDRATGASSLRSEYEQLYKLTMKTQDVDQGKAKSGALSSAMRIKQQQPIKQVSTIEYLIEIIISQPNKHERVDMLNFIHSQAQHNKLIDIDEWDQNISSAIYTSNQYKVAALRILNHLCVNEQAIKTILKCFSTPPPAPGQPIPENKIIRSIFECYQTAQEHIYQNEIMFHQTNYYHESAGYANAAAAQRGRKRSRQVDDDEYSDYGSRLTTSQQTSSLDDKQSGEPDERDDVVVREAIRLLVQLTTPFYRSNQGLDFYTLIGRFSIDSLVKYLTNIIKTSASREMIFLSLTALANISFITTEPIKLYGTNRVMMEMFRSSKNRSKDLELRDQAMTILANTAEKNLDDILNSGGLTFLLSCLESCPTKMYNYKQMLADRLRKDPLSDNGSIYKLNMDNKPRDRKPIDFREDFPDVLECACDELHTRNLQNCQLRTDVSPNGFKQSTYDLSYTPASLCLSRMKTNDLAALERIHQKTAVAFARMSVDPSTTRMVLKYGGIKQMIDLCKISYKRNHSDTVLIACLAALRKMAKVIESETFKYYNALDLIELELNRALEIYGNLHDHPNSFIDSRQAQQHNSRLFASDV